MGRAVTNETRYDICLYAPTVALRVAEQSAPGGAETQVTLLARAHHYQSYTQAHHSPAAIAEAWAKALHPDNGAAPLPQTATS
jgi:hypothetical protein